MLRKIFIVAMLLVIGIGYGVKLGASDFGLRRGGSVVVDLVRLRSSSMDIETGLNASPWIQQINGPIASVNPLISRCRLMTSISEANSNLPILSFGNDILDATVWIPDSLGGVMPRQVCYNPTNNEFYIYGGRRLTIIDGATNSQLKTITVDDAGDVNASLVLYIPESRRFAYLPTLNKIYCATESGKLVVIDCSVDTVEKIIDLSEGAWPRWGVWIDCNPNTNKIYYKTRTSSPIPIISRITCIDGITDTIVKEVEFSGRMVFDILCNPNVNKLYLSSVWDLAPTVLVLEGSSLEVVAELDVGGNPWMLTYNPNNNKVYCGNASTSAVTVIDSSDSIITQIDVTQPVQGILCNPVDNKIYAYWKTGTETESYCYVSIIESGSDIEIAKVSLPVLPAFSAHYTLAYNSISDAVFCASGNFYNDTLIIIDGVSNKIIGAGRTGAGPTCTQLAYNSTKNTMCSSNHCVGGASIINSDADVVTMLKIGDPVSAGCYNKLNNKVYLTQSYYAGGYNKATGVVCIMDGRTNQVINKILSDEGFWFGFPVFNELNNKVYVPSMLANIVKVIDGLGDTVITNIQVEAPHVVFWDSTTNKIYCDGSRGITIINGATDEIITTISVGDYLEGFTSNPRDRKVYGVFFSGSICVIDAVNDVLLTNIEVGGTPWKVLYNSVSNKIYSIDPSLFEMNPCVKVIDGTTDQVIKTIELPDICLASEYNPVKNKLYVGLIGASQAPQVYVIDGKSDEIIKKILTEQVNALIYNPLNNRIYGHCLAAYSDYQLIVQVIDCESDEIVSTVSLEQRQSGYFIFMALGGGASAEFMVYNSTDNKVYCGNYGLSNVSVIQCVESGVEEVKGRKMGTEQLEIYPNPFRQLSVIRYQLPVESKISLKIYDLTGRFVRTLVDEKKKPGTYSIKWDGKDFSGKEVGSGVYFYKLEADKFNKTMKLIRL
ncbi:MAG: FlgD immunoglobulin-like domain containing protein [bacterium]|nr:FlgD immunoglobulin-like domain containing protein [bacterium]